MAYKPLDFIGFFYTVARGNKDCAVFDWLRTKSKRVLGLDISTSAVKLLELSQANNQYRVESFAVSPLPPDCIIENQIKDVDTVATTIRDAMKKANTSAKYAAVSLPDSMVMTKILQVEPDLNEDEIESQILLEADKHIPFPVTEVNLDFQVMGPSSHHPSMNDILMVVSRSEHVNDRINAIEQAGLTPYVVDVESYVLERACLMTLPQLPQQGMDQIIAIIDIGSTATHLVILDNLEVVFSREEIFGGAQLTRDIQRHYGLSYAEAGRAKKEGNLPDDYEAEVLGPFKDLAVLQIRRALQFYFSVNQNAKIHTIMLVGGTPSIPGFASVIEEQMGIPTIVANPFHEASINNKVNLDALTKDSSALMMCCGLAMRGLT